MNSDNLFVAVVSRTLEVTGPSKRPCYWGSALESAGVVTGIIGGKQGRQRTYDVIMRRDRAPIVEVEKQ